MSKSNSPPKNLFKARLDLMESRENSFSLYLLITTLLLVIVISAAMIMDSTIAECPYPPHHLTLLVPLREGDISSPSSSDGSSSSSKVLAKVVSKLQREETPGFNVVWAGNYSNTQAALQAELERHRWSTVSYKDTSQHILTNNAMSLKIIKTDGEEAQQMLCEQSHHRCPLRPQIDLDSRLSASVDPFGSAPVYERCLTQQGGKTKTGSHTPARDVATEPAASSTTTTPTTTTTTTATTRTPTTLKSIRKSFPKGIHPEFFAESEANLVTREEFRTRRIVIAQFLSSWVVGKDVTLSLSETQHYLKKDGLKKGGASPPSSASAFSASSYLLTVSGEFKDPYTMQIEEAITGLRRHYWMALGPGGNDEEDGDEGGDGRGCLLDTRIKDSFLSFVQRSPVLPSS